MEDFLMPPVQAPVDPQALPPGLGNLPQVDGQAQQDAAALQNALQAEGAQGQSKEGTGFFDKLRSDPKLAQSMLMMGTALMNGQKPGQNAGGMWGNAIMAGALTHNMLTLNEQADGRAQQESDARVARDTVQTKSYQQKMDQDNELFPLMKQKYAEDIRAAKLRGDKEALLTLKAELENGTYMQRFKSEMALQAAQRSASGAQAASAMSLVADRKQEQKLRDVLVNPNSTPEERERARSALNYGSGSGQAAADRLEMEFQQMKKAHPTPPKGVTQEVHDQRLREMVIRGSHRVKGEDLASIRLAMNTAATAGDEAGYQSAKAQLDAYQQQYQSDRAWLRGEVTDGKTAPPPAPTEKKLLIKGTTYMLPDGRTGTWDGKNFNIQTQGK